MDLTRHINTLASDTLEGRAAGTDGGRAAGSYLVQQLRRLKLSPGGHDGDFFQEFSEQGYRNILAVIPGTDPALRHELILVGAHYDHVGLGTKRNSRGPLGQIHNGADDNASGTAAVLELAEAFCQRFIRNHGVPVKGLTPESLAALQGHDWPGNIRELQNVLERAVILCGEDGYIHPEQLGLTAPPQAGPCGSSIVTNITKRGSSAGAYPTNDPTNFVRE